MKRRDFFSAAALIGLTGCSSFYYGDKPGATWFPTDLIEANHRAVDALLANAPLDAQHPVMVATLVQVDRLGESSRLGRIFSEQIAGRMVQRGVRVVELKLRDSVALQRDQGELLLSREVREVSQSHDAQAVVVGTYARVSVGAVHQPETGNPGGQHRGGCPTTLQSPMTRTGVFQRWLALLKGLKPASAARF